MSQILRTFYNIFWQSKACQNLFLLSKDELLDRTTIGSGPDRYVYTVPRIIISNAQENEHFETIKLRSETHTITLDATIQAKIQHFKPIIEQFFSKRFEKAISKLTHDLQHNGLKVFGQMFRIILNEKKWEENALKFLHEYGFVGKHLKTFKDVENDLKTMFLPDKNNELVNEDTLVRLFDGIQYFKDLYVNMTYKRLYSTNQVLTSTLNIEDNFVSRLKLFHILYESGIIYPTTEDAFIECSNCDPGTYRGAFKLKINPKKLQDLKCPVCNRELTYFVPYELHPEIYRIIKSQDGLLLDVYCRILQNNNMPFSTNRRFLEDIEIDCIFEKEGRIYIVESKMYKQNTTTDRLKNKIRKHYGKLLNDVERMVALPEFKGKELVPILFTNVINAGFLQEVELQLKSENTGNHIQYSRILNLELAK